MEIRVNVPINDYVQPTEVREQAVQAICDAFLSNCVWSTFHPHSGERYRYATRYACERGFYSESKDDEKRIRFNGEEMKTAFEVLRKAGYHIFEVYEYSTWRGYRCEKKPHIENGREVFEFTDFID